jgi:hypothetical protein
MRPPLFAALSILLTASAALAQTTESAPPDEKTAEKAWAFSLSAYTYIVPNDREYVQPTFRADRDWFHLEARYNYEDRDPASVWLGYNWSIGETVTFDFTAMLGGVFGNTRGVAPGYEFTLAWHGLQLYSEAEFVIDTDDSADSFFYTWTELTYAPVEWFRFGVVIQRTKLYDTDFDIQRGFLVGLTWKDLDFTAAVLNPDEDPIFVLGVAYTF